MNNGFPVCVAIMLGLAFDGAIVIRSVPRDLWVREPEGITAIYQTFQYME